VYVAKAFSKQSQFLDAVAKAASGLPPGFVSITPTFGSDWEGEDAVFFQVVITGGLSRPERLALTKEIQWHIVQEVEPLEEWGVLSYFNFNTQHQPAKIEEPALG
jgi:hypothetical protein